MSPTPPLYVIRVWKDRDAGEFEDYPFTPGKFLLAEAIAIEEEAGLTWPQVIAGVGGWRVSALQAVIWILRKRKNPKLKLSGVVHNIEDLELLDPDLMPEYGGTAPADLEDEMALDDSADDEAPKDEGYLESTPLGDEETPKADPAG